MRESYLKQFLRLISLWLKRWIIRRYMDENLEITDHLFSPDARILILAPHPDDEAFGLGGYLLRYREWFNREEMLDMMGNIFICYLTDGEHSLPHLPAHEVKHNRVELSKRALHRLKFSHHNVKRFHLPDGCLRELATTELSANSASRNTYRAIAELIRDNRINTILVTHQADYWPFDHVAAFHLARKLSIENQCKLYGFWVWAWYQQSIANLWRMDKRHYSLLPIAEVWNEKLKLIDLYTQEKAADGSPWVGHLPKVFERSNKWKFEIVERII